jgi:hypothetical protein
MKPTAPFRCKLSVLATAPCRVLRAGQAFIQFNYVRQTSLTLGIRSQYLDRSRIWSNLHRAQPIDVRPVVGS